MKLRQIIPIIFGASFFFAFTSCEEIDPVVEKVKEALNRKSAKEVEEEIASRPISPEDIPPPPDPVKMEPIVNKEARVSVLGYHDFTEGKTTNDMVINIDDFRAQLEDIKVSELPVISMRQFLDWKQGKKDIPERSVMITIDDGWKATHTLAMKVLKEYDFPYTVFLYKKYVGVGGRSMTHDEIRELAANGATICSHSVSHNNMSRRNGKSQAAYDEWLRVELEDSHKFLEETFGDTGAVLKTFAFPYGIYNDRVLELAKELGYEACFTVNGKKTNWDTEVMEIGRYIVHGPTLANFDSSLAFGGGNVTSSGRKLITSTKNDEGEEQGPLITLSPEKDASTTNRLPRIEANLSKLENVQESTISMRITGFGKVPHDWDPITKTVSYQIPQRLRTEACGVQLGFRHGGNKDAEIISWNFKVDLLGSYTKETEALIKTTSAN